MYYEINVSFNGHRLFATDKRSAQSESEARRLYNIFAGTFTAAEGYKITVAYYEGGGKFVSFDRYRLNVRGHVFEIIDNNDNQIVHETLSRAVAERTLESLNRDARTA